jgi:hypothetical protein
VARSDDLDLQASASLSRALPLVDEPAGLEQDLLEALAERLARQRIPWLELELSLSPANDLTKRLLPGESALRPDDLPLPPAHDRLAVRIPEHELQELAQLAVVVDQHQLALRPRSRPRRLGLRVPLADAAASLLAHELSDLSVTGAASSAC